MSARRALAAAALPALLATAVSGCAPAVGATARPGVQVVASTDVYGDLAAQVAGPRLGHGVTVTSIITSPSQDPHEFEPDAHTQLRLAQADVVIENGGGYDDFVDRMLAAAGSRNTVVVNAVKISGVRPHGGDLNEHVFYDLPAVAKIVHRIAAVLAQRDRSHAAGYLERATLLTKRIAALENRARALRHRFAGAQVLITEPLPVYLLDACGLVNRTPAQVSDAIEAATEMPVRSLWNMLNLLQRRHIEALVYNAQTEGPQTVALIDAAHRDGVPPVGMTETLPTGDTYVEWMQHNLAALSKALQR
jgi:zinc/manganese transport system substrate-binding protein